MKKNKKKRHWKNLDNNNPIKKYIEKQLKELNCKNKSIC